MSATTKYKSMVGKDNSEELLLLAIMGMLSRNRCHRLIDVLEVYTLEEYSDFVEADRYIFQKIKDSSIFRYKC